MSKREKNILIFGAAFLVLFFGFQVLILPVFEKKKTLTRVLLEKRLAIEKIEEYQKQVQSLSGNIDIRASLIENRNKNFSLFAFLDDQARQSGVKENVSYMKPFDKKLDKSEYKLATVKVKLQSVYLKELIDFIYRIESSANGVVITSLSLTKSGKKKTNLDAIIETETLILKDNA